MTEYMLYPIYFDSSLSRREGRLVPTEESIEEPTVEEIAEAIQQIGYDSKIESDVSHPREGIARGRVLVKADDTTRQNLIHATAGFLSLIRERKP